MDDSVISGVRTFENVVYLDVGKESNVLFRFDPTCEYVVSFRVN